MMVKYLVKHILLYAATALVMAVVLFFTVPQLGFDVAAGISVIFLLMQDIAAAKDAIKAKWEIEEEIEKISKENKK